jgi:DNA-binding NarL/FixJ family response regulator
METAMMENPRVLIVDDHAIVRRGLKDILNDEFAETAAVGEAGTGQAALELARQAEWDVVILDIALPDRSGLAILKDLKAEHDWLPVLMLSTHASPYYVLGSLKAGAAGFLSKESAAEEIVAAIRTVMAGGHYVSRDLAQEMGLDL